MKRVRFLFRAIPNDADRQRFFTSLKSMGGSLGASLKHPRWTSYGALEVDAFTPSVQDFDLFVAAIEPLAKVEFTKNLDEPPAFKPIPAKLLKTMAERLLKLLMMKAKKPM